MADTGGCCGGRNGKHLPGCDGSTPDRKSKLGRAIIDRRKQQEAMDARNEREVTSSHRDVVRQWDGKYKEPGHVTPPGMRVVKEKRRQGKETVWLDVLREDPNWRRNVGR